VANPFARQALRRHWDGEPLELASFGDVPGGTGLGSSSAFCVALIAGLEAGRLSPETIAEAASEVEIHGLGRPVGRQDQYLSALGGFRELHFHRGGVESAAIPVPVGFVRRLDAELLLFFTGSTRDAGTVLSQQNAGLEDDRSTQRRLHEIKELVPVARDALVRAMRTPSGRSWAGTGRSSAPWAQRSPPARSTGPTRTPGPPAPRAASCRVLAAEVFCWCTHLTPPGTRYGRLCPPTVSSNRPFVSSAAGSS